MRDIDFIPAHVAEYDAIAEAFSAMEQRNKLKRDMERMACFTAWVEPEAIKTRVEKHLAEAAKALERGKLMAGERELLPVPDPLPKEMQGQSASTIQSMLRSGWKPKDEVNFYED